MGIKRGLGILVSLLVIGGCASDNTNLNTSVKVKTLKSEHPLYIQWDDKANNFEEKIRRKVEKGKLAFRIDNLKPINVPRGAYERQERSLLWRWTNGPECSKKYKFSKEVYPDLVFDGLFNVVGGFLTFGLIPIVSGITYSVDCVFDQQKFLQYVSQWIEKHPFDRKEILDLYNKQLALIKELNEDEKRIAELLGERYRRNGFYESLLAKEFPCALSTCEEILRKNYEGLEKLKKGREYALKVLEEKSYTLNDLGELLAEVQDTYMQEYLGKKVKKMLESVDVFSMELSEKAKKALEPYVYKQVMEKNDLEVLYSFKDMYPDSKYIDDVNERIKILKHKVALRDIKHNYFFDQWDEIEWKGSIGEDGWPAGKGELVLEKKLKSPYLPFGIGGIWAVTKIQAEVKNHEFVQGTATSYLVHIKNLFSKETTKSYSKAFKGTEGMYHAAIETVNAAIDEWNVAIEMERKSSGNVCSSLYSLCSSYCKYKSKEGSGFFSSSDQEKCRWDCEFAKEYCEKGDMTRARIRACMGICRGANDKLPLFSTPLSTTDYEKCLNECEIELEKKGYR